jgi:hypothetical protein
MLGSSFEPLPDDQRARRKFGKFRLLAIAPRNDMAACNNSGEPGEPALATVGGNK